MLVLFDFSCFDWLVVMAFVWVCLVLVLITGLRVDYCLGVFACVVGCGGRFVCGALWWVI